MKIYFLLQHQVKFFIFFYINFFLGAKIGHRSLFRYFKQSLKDDSDSNVLKCKSIYKNSLHNSKFGGYNLSTGFFFYKF